MGQVAEGPEPVVDADEDDAPVRDPGAVVERVMTPAEVETATVNPNHDRQVLSTRRSPDIEGKTVLAGGGQLAAAHRRERGWLRTNVAERLRVANAVPRGRGSRRTPAQVADGRCRVRDAAEDVGTIREDVAPQLPCVDGDDMGVREREAGEERANQYQDESADHMSCVSRGPVHVRCSHQLSGRFHLYPRTLEKIRIRPGIQLYRMGKGKLPKIGFVDQPVFQLLVTLSSGMVHV